MASPRWFLALTLACLASGARAEDVGGADLTASPPVDAETLPTTLTGTLAKIRASGDVTLGFRASALPFSYVNAGGNPAGYSIDLCQGIVARIERELQGPPLKIVYAPVTSENRVDAVASGAVDLECGSTTDNPERRTKVAFSPLIFVAGTKLMVANGSPIRSARDLKDKTVVVTAGSTNEAVMRSLNDKYKLGATIITAPDHESSYQLLTTAKADAFATDDVLLNGLIASHHAQSAMRVVGDYLSFEPYGLMFRKDDPDMAAAVRRAFSAMAGNGQLMATYRAWFLTPAPGGVSLDLPMSPQLSEAFRAMGAEGL